MPLPLEDIFYFLFEEYICRYMSDHQTDVQQINTTEGKFINSREGVHHKEVETMRSL